MKKLSIVFISIFAVFVILSSFTPVKESYQQEQTVKIKSVPAEVSAIIEQKCYGCHNSESRNEEARDKLSFDKWDDLNALQKLSKTKDVHQEVIEGKMPPEKFLERFPDRKLTDEEIKTLVDWANKELGK
ncbi:MAG: heme-binding domain-containing protein [Prolixibacteraceae bacterium]|nr:heme-binding domain-containing protein [Prolixibacteraceae bacterium]MBN2772757.1 heme-binding domain-containing protein [Prolixibacteraceae bacterium]